MPNLDARSQIVASLRDYADSHKRLPTRIICHPARCSQVWLALRRSWGQGKPVAIVGDRRLPIQALQLE